MILKWSLVPDGKGGWVGTVAIPLRTEPEGGEQRALVKQATGETKAAALGKAAALAKKIAASPVLQALLPPQAAVALKATTALAKAAQVGKLAAVAKRFTGPAMKRLAGLFS